MRPSQAIAPGNPVRLNISMRLPQWTVFAGFLVLAVAALVSGCGGDDDGETDGPGRSLSLLALC